MTSPYSYSEPVRHAWAGHEAFRRLGFGADDIFTIVARSANNDGKFAMHSTLRTQGKEFNIVCGVYASQAEAERDFKAFADFRNLFMTECFSESELQKIFREALASWGGGTALVNGLMERGFLLPRGFRR